MNFVKAGNIVSKDMVVQYLQLLLQGADLQSTSEDSLKRMLKSYFMQDMSQFDTDVQVRRPRSSSRSVTGSVAKNPQHHIVCWKNFRHP